MILVVHIGRLYVGVIESTRPMHGTNTDITHHSKSKARGINP